MAMTKEQILAAALALDPQERDELAEQLWLSVEGSSDEELDEAWAREVEDRIKAYEGGEVGSKPVDEVIQRLLTRRRA